jgi:photosynthetic reaction center cytochrome c subunit
MKTKSMPACVWITVLASALLTASAHSQTAPSPQPPISAPPAAASPAPASSPAPTEAAAPADAAKPAEPTAEKVYKNIQVLTGMPASQMMPVMHIMRASLGVRCDYCHTGAEGEWDQDTKRAKKTARQMIQMTFDINKNSFRGQTEVTCNTCHHGQSRPVAMPPVEQGQFADTTRSTPTPREPLPSTAQVIDKYLEALGGRPALEGVKTRVSRGTLLHVKVVDAGTPKATAVNRGQEDPLEFVQDASGKFRMTLGPAAARTVQVFDGTAGVIKTPTEEQPLTPAQIKRLSALIDLQKDVRMRDRVERLRVVGKDQVNGRDAYVVRGAGEDGRRESLYFDVQSGLLLRRVAYTVTVMGADPEQTDFEDYRDVGGVKVPFTVKTTYLDDNHLGLTRRLTEVKNNVPVEPTAFQAR